MKQGRISYYVSSTQKLLKYLRMIHKMEQRYMTREEISKRLCRVVAQHLALSADCVTEDNSFEDDLHADSLDKVEIIMALEEEFALEIEDGIADAVSTVGGAIDAVAVLLGAGDELKCIKHCKAENVKDAVRISECWGWVHSNGNILHEDTYSSSTAAFAEMCRRLSLSTTEPGSMDKIYKLGFTLVMVEKKLSVIRVLE